MANETKRRYAINFDLKIALLEKYYSATKPKQAYKDIARFMKANGFSHRQWSGYISDRTMTRTELLDFVKIIHDTFPWLINCEENMDATVITNIFDIKRLILDSMEADDEDMGI